MKNQIIALLISLSFILFSQCKKDICDNIVCLNGGNCVNGDCLCPSGWAGPDCSQRVSQGPCDGIVCHNGGNCANGICICTNGWGGPDCSQQVTPKVIYVTRIDILKFPATFDGAGWDFSSGPDIYPELKLGSVVIWTTSTFFQNANPAITHTFNVSPAAEIKSPSSAYELIVYDYDDFDPDDFMGRVVFQPYNSTNRFPTQITLDGGIVAFKIYLTYEW